MDLSRLPLFEMMTKRLSWLGRRQEVLAENIANADTPHDATTWREFGAQGVGLCRTEHMFFGEERLPVVQEMILASDEAAYITGQTLFADGGLTLFADFRSPWSGVGGPKTAPRS